MIAARRRPRTQSLLAYGVCVTFDRSVGARIENAEFCLAKAGPGPLGIDENRNIPLVQEVDDYPNPAISLGVFAATALISELTLERSNGIRMSKQSDMTAPIAGVALEMQARGFAEPHPLLSATAHVSTNHDPTATRGRPAASTVSVASMNTSRASA